MKKTALITGASSGIGQATAIYFSEQGWHCLLVGRNKSRLEQTLSLLKTPGQLLVADLTNEVDLKSTIQYANELDQAYRLECLVNNAAIFEYKTTEQSTSQHWNEQFSTNLMAPVLLTQGLLPIFKRNKLGSIVNISSTLGLKPTANTAAYSATKAALNNWTQSLALELGQFGIRVNAICPGLVDTPIHSFHSLPENEKEKAVDALKHLQPLGRIGTAKEIAQSIYFLGSDLSSWTTGALLSVDGGIQIS